jgi:tetratricopeptide (TPR) repeat protein
MKLRENFYQREIYGPRVRALRSQASDEEQEIFEEFARIQQGVAARIEEGLIETEALLGQTLDQLRRLLASHRGDSRVTRFLVDHASEVEAAFEQPFDVVLSDLYGDAGHAWEIAGRALLRSGYYAEAIDALDAAARRGGDAGSLGRLASYGRGMAAYLARDYAGTVEHLGAWAGEGPGEPPELARLAREAVKRIGQLVMGDDRERVAREAEALLSRISAG